MSERAVFERHYRSPPGRVFDAWTNVDQLSRWYGCGPDMLWDVHVWEPHVGGALHVSMEMEDRVDIHGEFLVVDRPSQLRFRWHEEQTITVTFTPDDAGTHLRIEHDGLPGAFEVEMVTGGWSNSVEQLASALDVSTT